MWKNIVQRDRPKMTIWRMRVACWITKATDTLIAIPRQEWFRERASMLRHTYMAYLVEHSSSTWSDAMSSSVSSRHLKGSYILRCVIPVVLSQILQCIICMYLHTYAVRNTTINRWYHCVIYITVHYTTTCFGLINDGPFIRPKHVVVYCTVMYIT